MVGSVRVAANTTSPSLRLTTFKGMDENIAILSLDGRQGDGDLGCGLSNRDTLRGSSKCCVSIATALGTTPVMGGAHMHWSSNGYYQCCLETAVERSSIVRLVHEPTCIMCRTQPITASVYPQRLPLRFPLKRETFLEALHLLQHGWQITTRTGNQLVLTSSPQPTDGSSLE